MLYQHKMWKVQICGGGGGLEYISKALYKDGMTKMDFSQACFSRRPDGALIWKFGVEEWTSKPFLLLLPPSNSHQLCGKIRCSTVLVLFSLRQDRHWKDNRGYVYQKEKRRDADKSTIHWVSSHTDVCLLRLMKPVFKACQLHYGERSVF